MAGLVSLVGFGLDSGIESAAAVLVGLRLASRLRHGDVDEAKERRTLKAVAVTFYVLAAYVTFEGVRSLLGGEAPETSWIGIGLLIAARLPAWRFPVLSLAALWNGLHTVSHIVDVNSAETKAQGVTVVIELAAVTVVLVALALGSRRSGRSA